MGWTTPVCSQRVAVVHGGLFVEAVQQGRGPVRAGPLAQTIGLARRCAPRPLRCSVAWPAAKLAPLTCVRCARTIAASQKTMRACGARPVALRFSGASRFAPGPARPDPRPCPHHRGTREPRTTVVSARLWVGPRGGEYRDAREAQLLRPRAAGALRDLTHRDCSSTANAVSGASSAVGRRSEHRRGRAAERRATARC